MATPRIAVLAVLVLAALLALAGAAFADRCATAYGEMRCARTPMGACGAAYGQVLCWDPDPDTLRAYRGRRSRPAAACVAQYGTIACGFACTAAYGQVRCAQTPAGTCIAAYGEVTCWDPDPADLRHRRGATARCRAEYGTVACGFGCAAGFGQIRCATTPDDQCFAHGGEVKCTGD